MKKTKRMLYVLLALCLLLTGGLSASALNIGDITELEQTAVLSANLLRVMADAASDERIPVDIWVEEVDIGEVEAAALEETGLNKAKIAELDAAGAELTIEEIDKYIAAERRIYAERQKALNEQAMQSALGSAKARSLFAQREVYVSSYAPVVSIELTKSEVQQLATASQVKEVYYAPNMEIATIDPIEEPSTNDIYATDNSVPLSTAFEKIRANRTRDELGYTGKGIRIGQVEPCIPDTSKSYLKNASITTNTDFWDTQPDDHASMVAGIMVSNGSTRGIVPDAQLYSVSYLDSYDLQKAVEWLLGKEASVQVINMSAGRQYNGEYDDRCKWFDHIALNHSVHFVKSAGNEGNDLKYTSSPGMAANVITVGAINQAFTARAGFSSYLEGDSSPWDKPDICAPGENLDIFNNFNHSGTSFATPMVTSIVAQLIQARPALATTQDTVKAILTAAIHDETLRYTPGTTGYAECGAGLVDALSAVNVARYQAYTLNQSIPAGSSMKWIQAKKFTVSPGTTLTRVSVAWLKNNRFSSSDHTYIDPTNGILENIDMRITDPNGKEVGYAATIKSNVEIIQFIPKMTGEYTIWLQIISGSTDKTYYGLAWW